MNEEISGFDVRLMNKLVELGFSQAELCKATGISSSQVSYYCSGFRLPTLPVAIKIAQALKTTVEYLAYGPVPEAKPIDKDALTLAESAHIKKYRALDERGRETVDAALETAYNQVAAPYEKEAV